MWPGALTLLALNLVALGFIAVILSFLVPDRKKSCLSMIFGLLVIVTGVYHVGTQTFSKNRIAHRFDSHQTERRREEIRKKLEQRLAETKSNIENIKKKSK